MAIKEKVINQKFIKFIILFGLVLPVILIGFISYRQLKKDYTENIFSRRQSIAYLSSTLLEEKFDRLVDMAVSFATRVKMRQFIMENKWDETRPIIKNIPRNFSNITHIFLTDTNGIVPTNFPEAKIIKGQDFSSSDWYKQVKTNRKPFVSPIYKSALPPFNYVIAISVPVKNEEGKFIAILTIESDIQKLLAWTKKVSVGKEGGVLIVDPHETVVDETGIKDYSSVPFIEKVLRGERGVGIFFDPIMKEKILASYEPVLSYNWGTIARQPEEEAFKGIDKHLQSIRLIFILIISISFILAYLIIRNIIARQKAEQSLLAKNEEINIANERLETTQEELRTLNEQLEEKVMERTKELEESRELLKQSENQIKLITNTIPAFISYIDDKSVYRYANNYYLNLSFVTGELSGKSVKEVLGEEAYNISKPYIERALKGETLIFENRLQLKDGSEKFFKVSYIPDKEERGIVRGIVVMGIDLTDRLGYENRLKNKNETLSKINNDLDNFIYVASHDLKAPIANLEGLLNAIYMEKGEQCTAEMNEYFDLMRKSIEKFKITISDLTDVSRIQKDIEEDVEEVNINELLEEFEISHNEEIDREGAIVRKIIETPSIRSSKQNLRSILENLLTNAIKYRSPERKPEILVQTKREEDYIALTVKDNGLGFDMKQKDKIFGMFKRLHTHVEGSGVGLYIVKRIIDNSGGKIEVNSEVGKGSVFKVYFRVNT